MKVSELMAGVTPSAEFAGAVTAADMAVSYTHLDVYKRQVDGDSIYVEIIPRSRIFPRHWGPNRRLDAGYFTDFDKLDDGTAVVRVEAFAMQADGLQITNNAYRLKEHGWMGAEIPLSDVPRWAELQPELLIRGIDRPHFGLLRMPLVNTVDGSACLLYTSAPGP